jgi:hypothetical protein
MSNVLMKGQCCFTPTHIDALSLAWIHRCGHCKAIAPAWKELGDHYAGSSSVLIADVDCTVEEKLCSEFEVSAYAVKYCRRGTHLTHSLAAHLMGVATHSPAHAVRESQPSALGGPFCRRQ